MIKELSQTRPNQTYDDKLTRSTSLDCSKIALYSDPELTERATSSISHSDHDLVHQIVKTADGKIVRSETISYDDSLSYTH